MNDPLYVLTFVLFSCENPWGFQVPLQKYVMAIHFFFLLTLSAWGYFPSFILEIESYARKEKKTNLLKYMGVQTEIRHLYCKQKLSSLFFKQVIKIMLKKDDKCCLKFNSSKQKHKVLILGIIDLKSIEYWSKRRV